MARQLKLMSGLPAFALALAFSTASCGEKSASEIARGEPDQTAADSEEVGASSSESAKSELSVRSGDPATDDVAYLKLLGLARGHLSAFYELYQGGFKDSALPHLEYADNELYARMIGAFNVRKLPGFSDKLEALIAMAAAGDDIDSNYSALIADLDSHTPKTGAAVSLLAISEIVRTAADAFDASVEDNGAVSKPHDYQDAYGFLVASRDILSSIETTDVNETDAIGLAHEQIEAALASFDGLTADTTEGQASAIYGAASRIEIAAQGLS